MTEGYSPLGERFLTRSEVKLIAINPGLKDQKTKMEKETKE